MVPPSILRGRSMVRRGGREYIDAAQGVQVSRQRALGHVFRAPGAKSFKEFGNLQPSPALWVIQKEVLKPNTPADVDYTK
jgi:hypothetical protein